MCALLSCRLNRLCFARCYSASSIILQSTIIHYSMLYATIPYSGVDSRCAVQPSALCNGVVALLICSARTVVAHFSIGLTEQRHRQSGAARSSRDQRGRRQDNVRFVVPGPHRFSSAGADLLCQMAPVRAPSPRISSSVARSSMRSQEHSIPAMSTPGGTASARPGIVSIERSVGPHGVPGHRHRARHGDTGPLVAGTFGERLAPSS